MLEFAITFKPDKDMKPERIVKLARQAEAAGFTYGWSFDSHIIWQDPYPVLTLMAANTEQMRLGTCVTNPLVRDPTVTASLLATLNLVSHGRMDFGIGRGDSSRRVMGKKQATVARLEETVHLIQDLTAGKQVNYQGQPIQISWADAGIPPVWIAGYGPKMLRCAGRVADGVIFQFADPELIQWCMGFVHEGAQMAGRDASTIRVMSAAAVWPSEDLAAAREQVRWFPALVSNHVVDLLSRYPAEELPEGLTTYARARDGYDYLQHCEVGSENEGFVSDEVVDRFCIVGSVQEHVRRLRELQRAGVTQFNIYLMSGEEEKTLEIYGRDIIPALREGE